MDITQLIEAFNLEPHPLEGGYFRRTYCSDESVRLEIGERALASAIYYALTLDQPLGYLHRNRSDILHCHHSGAAVRYLLVDESQGLREYILGSDVDQGQTPQLLVKGGTWKASELLAEPSLGYALITEVVIPAFEYKDNELATIELVQQWPKSWRDRVLPYLAR